MTIVKSADKFVENFVKGINAREVERDRYADYAHEIEYCVSNGRKYAGVFEKSKLTGGKCRVLCFVNRETGEMYKPASWKAPQTDHVRYVIDSDEMVEKVVNVYDFAGSFLYLDRARAFAQRDGIKFTV